MLGSEGAARTLLELVLLGLLALLFRNGGEVFGIALGDEVPYVGREAVHELLDLCLLGLHHE